MLNCGDQTILNWFQTKIESIDKTYTDSMTDVVNDLRKSIVLALTHSENQCIGEFGNCFIDLKERKSDKVDPSDLCYNEDPTSAAKTKQRQDTFTFFVYVELLRMSNYLKTNDDKKTMIRIIQNVFFDQNGGGKRLPILQTVENCKHSFRKIRSEEFTDHDLKSQLQDIEFVRKNCIDRQIYNDYTKYISEDKPHLLGKCFKDLKEKCYEKSKSI